MDIETIIERCRQHGQDDEPDHEVGDLQDVLRAAWGVMTEAQKAELQATPEFVQVAETWGEEASAPSAR
jgi:hypothetical protein